MNNVFSDRQEATVQASYLTNALLLKLRCHLFVMGLILLDISIARIVSNFVVGDEFILYLCFNIIIFISRYGYTLINYIELIVLCCYKDLFLFSL